MDAQYYPENINAEIYHSKAIADGHALHIKAYLIQQWMDNDQLPSAQWDRTDLKQIVRYWDVAIQLALTEEADLIYLDEQKRLRDGVFLGMVRTEADIDKD